jgi:tetratricopeptide (TPR) repeat protein
MTTTTRMARAPGRHGLAALLLTLAAGPVSAADFDACWAHLSAAKWAEAAPCFEAVVAENPEWSWGHAYLGQAYLGLGKLDQALAAFEKAQALMKPDDAGLEPYFGAAQVYFVKKQHDKALDALRRGEPYVSPELRPEVLALRGLIHLESGRSSQALADLEKSGRKDFDTQFALGRAAYQAEDLATATDALEAALAQRKGEASVAQYLSLAYYRRAEATSDDRTRQALFAKAADVGRALLRADPGSVEGHDLIGRALMGAGSLEAAEVELGEVLKLDPTHCAAKANLAQLALARKQLDRAVDLGSKALTCLPRDQARDAHLTVGHAFAAKAKQVADGIGDGDIPPREAALGLYESALKQYRAADAIRSSAGSVSAAGSTEAAMAALREQVATIKRNQAAEAANAAAAAQEKAAQERRRKLEQELDGKP